MFDIVKYPDPILGRQCDDVTVFGQELKALVDRMAETMYSLEGIGLAANQIGLSQRLVLVDPSAGDVSSEFVALVNPRVKWVSSEREFVKEGCLSLPGTLLAVSRPIACDVEYLDLDGAIRLIRCTGLKARIVQHEIDHLLGVTMFDRVGPLSRRGATKSLQTKR